MINEEIRDKEVRLIDSDGTMLGIMSAKDAQKLAINKNLDLVKIAPKAVPPVCKIMDYGSICLRLQRRKRLERIKDNHVKEVWIKPTIEDHDFSFKAKNIQVTERWGLEGECSVQGQEMNYTSWANRCSINSRAVAEVGTVEEPKLKAGI